MEPLRRLNAMEGPAAPPRRNGELVFEAPWEGRAFSMALALHAEGVYDWTEFSEHLAAEIAEHASEGAPEAVLPVAPGTETAYYERWLESLQTLLLEKGIISGDELEARTAEFAAGTWDDH